uniref:Uncharacterized protein n=1 Tax=Astyanax mexicanus TaxID=7994 RepID=A0A3B1JFP3_ASTMX
VSLFTCWITKLKLLYNSVHQLSGCSLTSEICGLLGSALQVQNSPLRELDLSNNNLLDSGVKQFLPVLKHPHCKLETLKSVLSLFLKMSFNKCFCSHFKSYDLTLNKSLIKNKYFCFYSPIVCFFSRSHDITAFSSSSISTRCCVLFTVDLHGNACPKCNYGAQQWTNSYFIKREDTRLKGDGTKITGGPQSFEKNSR